MKHLLMLIGCVGAALAAEFRCVEGTVTPPQFLTPSEERTWTPAGERPFRAKLQGIQGEWGNEAAVILCTPTGRRLEYAAYTLSDADLDVVRTWLKANSFESFETYREGKQLVRILSVVPLRDSYYVRLVLSNGNCYALKTNLKPMTATEARVQVDDRFKVTNATLEMLQRYAACKTEEAPVLPVVTSVDDALLYAALHRVGIVVMYLNRRGSAVDVAFRQYVEAHPEWVNRWEKQFVFMLMYADDNGLYSPKCHEDTMRLYYAYNVVSEHTKYPFHSEAATAGLRNATLHNTQQVNYAVFYHHVLNGNPYQRRAQKGMLSGSVFADRLFNARQDEFNFYSK